MDLGVDILVNSEWMWRLQVFVFALKHPLCTPGYSVSWQTRLTVHVVEKFIFIIPIRGIESRLGCYSQSPALLNLEKNDKRTVEDFHNLSYILCSAAKLHSSVLNTSFALTINIYWAQETAQQNKGERDLVRAPRCRAACGQLVARTFENACLWSIFL